MTCSPQLLREVLLDPLHVVPEPRALGHPELGQVMLLPEAHQAQPQDQGRHQRPQQEQHRVADGGEDQK